MKAILERYFLLGLIFLTTLAPRAFSQAAVFRPGDSFDLRMTNVPDPYGQQFTGNFTIADDGTVGIPLLKDSVKASGLSPDGLAKAIDDRLVGEKIFVHPLAIVTPPERSRIVTVGGPGMRGGSAVPWTPDMTLSSAISRGGGFSEYGNQTKIKVIRGGKGTFFNLKKQDKDPNQNPRLLPGDEVVVSD